MAPRARYCTTNGRWEEFARAACTSGRPFSGRLRSTPTAVYPQRHQRIARRTRAADEAEGAPSRGRARRALRRGVRPLIRAPARRFPIPSSPRVGRGAGARESRGAPRDVRPWARRSLGRGPARARIRVVRRGSGAYSNLNLFPHRLAGDRLVHAPCGGASEVNGDAQPSFPLGRKRSGCQTPPLTTDSQTRSVRAYQLPPRAEFETWKPRLRAAGPPSVVERTGA
jgi:hypothetical protein